MVKTPSVARRRNGFAALPRLAVCRGPYRQIP